MPFPLPQIFQTVLLQCSNALIWEENFHSLSTSSVSFSPRLGGSWACVVLNANSEEQHMWASLNPANLPSNWKRKRIRKEKEWGKKKPQENLFSQVSKENQSACSKVFSLSLSLSLFSSNPDTSYICVDDIFNIEPPEISGHISIISSPLHFFLLYYRSVSCWGLHKSFVPTTAISR